jgi:hypothetical protein
MMEGGNEFGRCFGERIISVFCHSTVVIVVYSICDKLLAARNVPHHAIVGELQLHVGPLDLHPIVLDRRIDHFPQLHVSRWTVEHARYKGTYLAQPLSIYPESPASSNLTYEMR